MIIFSAHSDTNFKCVKLKQDGESYTGYLDNYVGVYALVKAYFSGQINYDYVRTELTYGEETDFGGALEVAEEVKKNDLVVVIDVTATPTEKDFVIEKCKDPHVQKFVKESLEGFEYDIYEGCPDPVSNMDEVEVYKKKTDYYFFLGLPCCGGDYNADEVRCKIRSVDEVSKAVIALCRNYKNFDV
jgi:hypothetical protein